MDPHSRQQALAMFKTGQGLMFRCKELPQATEEDRNQGGTGTDKSRWSEKPVSGPPAEV